MFAIRPCVAADFAEIHAVCNDGATAYRGAIADDHWHDPYMSAAELRQEIHAGVEFFGAFDGDRELLGVMGLQRLGDVALIRHAYTRTARQGIGVGSALLAHLQSFTDLPILIGTWKAAAWAIRFYEGRGFRLIGGEERERLLRLYWTVPESQVKDSVVLGDDRWFSRTPG